MVVLKSLSRWAMELAELKQKYYSFIDTSRRLVHKILSYRVSFNRNVFQDNIS